MLDKIEMSTLKFKVTEKEKTYVLKKEEDGKKRGRM